MRSLKPGIVSSLIVSTVLVKLVMLVVLLVILVVASVFQVCKPSTEVSRFPVLVYKFSIAGWAVVFQVSKAVILSP
jgi:hypothetical protein